LLKKGKPSSCRKQSEIVQNMLSLSRQTIYRIKDDSAAAAASAGDVACVAT